MTPDRPCRTRSGLLARVLAWVLAWVRALVLATLAQAAAAAEAVADAQLLAGGHSLQDWQASASDQVSARLAPDAHGPGLCLHYDFHGVSGYAVARLNRPLTLPPHYRFALQVSGQGPANDFQIKWVDASGDNVWWHPRRGFSLPARPTLLVSRQRQVDFAWGPTDDKTLRQAAATELVVASGPGGAGRLCFDQLAITPLPPPGAAPAPQLRHSATATTLDLGQPTEFNGVTWQWASPGPHRAELQLSDDGRHWRTVQRLAASQRPQPALWLPEHEARHLRLRSRSAVRGLRVVAPAEWPDRNALLKDQAQTANQPASHMPRAFHGQQSYWTLVGTPGGARQAALVDEDGAIEPRRGGPSLAPLLIDDQGQALGWAEVQTHHQLPQGQLPQPQVQWLHPRVGLTLDTSAQAGPATLLARYTVHNPTAQRQRWTLALLLRPWQVNPPQQFLNTPGGVAPVRQLAWAQGRLQVNGQAWLQPVQAPARVLAAAFDDGDVLGPAARPLTRLHDPQGLASARLDWPLDLAPGERRRISVLLAADDSARAPADDAAVGRVFEATAQAWQARLGAVQFTLPPQARPLLDSLRAAHAQILMSADGPALQPGTRSYARSWVRDGAMMVIGLLRLGDEAAARDFVQWYAGQLFASGKVPCCVDARGADPVAENDSHGQFIVAVAQVWRHSGDTAWLRRLWPQVDAAARYMASLSDSERSAARQHPERAAFDGLMPASISHEGYSAKPMHSHWDNLWALAGWREATALARALGLDARAAALAQEQARFRADLGRSLALSLAQHQIQHLPGAVELGDFDPTSSTVVFSPGGAEDLVPEAVLRATWQRYWDEVASRRQRSDWADYTPYELRSVSALVRLGEVARAHALLDFFLADQRPAGWHGWAEVVGRQPRQPRFIGDMPHAWIASDYIRSALDLLAYERERDDALVLGAGVPAAWLDSGAVGVQDLRSVHGRLSYQLRRLPDGRPQLQLAPGLRPPAGGLWLAWAGQLLRVPDPPTGPASGWTWSPAAP